jgi:hypothetical protein
MDVSDVAVGEVGKGDAVQSRWRQVLHPKLQFSLNICLLGLDLGLGRACFDATDTCQKCRSWLLLPEFSTSALRCPALPGRDVSCRIPKLSPRGGLSDTASGLFQ